MYSKSFLPLMETLIKQARVRFSDVRQEEAAPQRTTSRSFKGEKSNWFQRQFSGTMSKDYETSDGGDYSAAVAAAAYAISSLYDHHNDNTPQKKKLPEFETPDASSTKIRAKTEDASVKIPQPARRSRSLSESSAAKIQGKKEDMMTKMHEPARGSKTSSDDDSSGSDEKLTSVRKLFGKAPPIKRKISFADDLPNPTEVKEAERAITAKPSLKKRPTFTDDNPWLKRPTTFADNTLDRVETQRPETAGLKVGNDFPKPDTIIKTATRAQGSKAATWERAEMGRIKQRYEKLRSTIDSWENKKKDKAKQKKEKRERDLEQKRVRVLQQFRHEMENIDAVARGARAEAEKKKNKEELKVKKKANRIRTTGKLPPTCLCF